MSDDFIMCILGSDDGNRVAFRGYCYTDAELDEDGLTYHDQRYYLKSYVHLGELRRFYIAEGGSLDDAGKRIKELWRSYL